MEKSCITDHHVAVRSMGIGGKGRGGEDFCELTVFYLPVRPFFFFFFFFLQATLPFFRGGAVEVKERFGDGIS